MSLKERLNQDLKEAIKTRDETGRSVLRMLKAGILEAEVALRAKKGRDYTLNDEEVLEVITRYAKQRTQSIEAYRAGGREDLAAGEEAELSLLEKYLPRQLSREELSELVGKAIQETGATSMRDLGQVMRVVMPEVKGAADGNLVRQLVQELLK